MFSERQSLILRGAEIQLIFGDMIFRGMALLTPCDMLGAWIEFLHLSFYVSPLVTGCFWVTACFIIHCPKTINSKSNKPSLAMHAHSGHYWLHLFNYCLIKYKKRCDWTDLCSVIVWLFIPYDKMFINKIIYIKLRSFD